MKTLNDFTELVADLNAMLKKEKEQDARNFIQTVIDNVELWQIRFDFFVRHNARYSKELDKGDVKK